MRSLVLPDANIEVLDTNDFEVPIFGVDLEEQIGVPESAQRFYEKVGAADVILMSFAEHNGHYSAAYKNLFDWVSRIDGSIYRDTPSVFFSVSPGPNGAKKVLEAATKSSKHFGADLKASLSIPSFEDNFDQEKDKLTNTKLQADLITALEALR